MKYPLISEYIDSILCSDENFDSLNYLRPVLDQSGNPVMSSGNFAVVFKMRSEKDGRYYALKCFLKDQAGRGDAYRMISDELEHVSSPYLAHVAYYDSELFVDANGSDDTEFPVLLMDWVDGMPLDVYVREHRDDKFALHELAYRFSKLSLWLLTQPFAHGDLKPGNILVTSSGDFVLIDYDGMYVPKMQGSLSRELGDSDYCHPNRTSEDFNERIDDFSLSVLALSLKAISLDPSLLDRSISGDGLLLSVSDFRNPSESELLKSLSSFFYDSEFERLYSLFLITHSCGSLSNVSFRLMEIEKLVKLEICEIEENLSTKVTKDDIVNGVTDEYGVVYSKDGKRLLKGNYKIEEYNVREGTKVICDSAFSWCKSLSSITLPSGITFIGDSAFSGCSSLSSIVLPGGVTSIGDSAFSCCESLSSIVLPGGVTSIGDSAFSCCESLSSIVLPKSLKHIEINPFVGCKCHIKSISPYFKVKDNVLYNSDMSKLISYLSEETNFIVPCCVTSIGDSAFSWCKSLSSITLPNGVTSIGKHTFSNCSSLKSITLPNGVTSIGDSTFSYCSSLKSITLPNGVTSIGKSAFDGCCSLSSITLPSGVTSIGEGAFFVCSSLKSITLPNGVTSIGKRTFSNCSSLKSITLPNGVTSISEEVFYGCCSLSSITLPCGVTSIGKGAFRGCSSLKFITLPNGVTSIGNYTFYGCCSLSSITFPSGVTSIGEGAFWYCSYLKSITLPNGVTSIGKRTFSNCSSLKSITLPNGVTSIGEDAFNNCIYNHRTTKTNQKYPSVNL